MRWRGAAACLAAAALLGAGLEAGPAARPAAAAEVKAAAEAKGAAEVTGAPEVKARSASVEVSTRSAGARVVTARAAAAVRTAGAPLNIRNNASTWNAPVGRLGNGVSVPARCQLGGETIAGSERTTSLWLYLGDKRFVSDAYVRWSPRRPKLAWCDQPGKRAPASQAKFIRWAAQQAKKSQRRYQVPISVTVAQAINESGWGRSALTTEGNAFFGIKCFGTPGPVAAGCRPYRTSECDQNGCGPTTDTFRVYHTAARSFVDHGRFLTVNPRYQPAFKHTKNPNRFAREIHKAGYATDPRYSDKLIGLMRQYDLYRFDR